MAAIDPSASTVATSALQAIPFSELIGGPLDAAVQAQYKAAQTTWEFINQVGLYEDPETLEKKAVQVVFQYQKGGEMVNLVVPLITIVPIPYLVIDEVTIDFLANISAASSTYNEVTESESIEAGLSGGAKVGWGPFSAHVDFNGSYSSKRDSKATQESQYSVEYTMSVHVKASGGGQMPGGLASVLNILNSSIEESKPGGALEMDRKILKLMLGDPPQILEVVIKDDRGLLVSNQEVTFAQEPGIGDGKFYLGDEPGLRYTIVLSDANEVSQKVTTDSNGVAKVKVTGKKKGLAALKATSTLNNVKLEGRITVTIVPALSSAISLDPTSIEVNIDKTKEVTATVTDDQITELNATSDALDIFEVASPVTVEENGKATIAVKGKVEGEGKMTVSGGGYKAAAYVKVVKESA